MHCPWALLHSCQLPEWKIRDKYLSRRAKIFDHAPYFEAPWPPTKKHVFVVHLVLGIESLCQCAVKNSLKSVYSCFFYFLEVSSSLKFPLDYRCMRCHHSDSKPRSIKNSGTSAETSGIWAKISELSRTFRDSWQLCFYV